LVVRSSEMVSLLGSELVVSCSELVVSW
jgi:hypothetical protein